MKTNVWGRLRVSCYHFMTTFRSKVAVFLSDPFDEVSKGDETSVQVDDIHIRIQQRSGRKTLTTIQGISHEYDLKKILKQFKKVW